jgi:AFG3 family protein
MRTSSINSLFQFRSNLLYRSLHTSRITKEEDKEQKDDRREESSTKKEKKLKNIYEESGDHPKSTIRMILFLLIVLFMIHGYNNLTKEPTSNQITFQTFVREYLSDPKLDHLEYDLQRNRVYVYMGTVEHNRAVREEHTSSELVESGNKHSRTIKRQTGGPSPGAVCYFTTLSADDFEEKLQEAEIELGIPPSKSTKIIYTKTIDFGGLLTIALEPLAFLALFLLSSRALGRRGGGPMGIFKATQVNKSVATKSNVTFKDVAGMEEAKLEISEFVSILKNPDQYQKLGAKTPRGAILMGPPGTGKTLLAKALAGESDVPFFSMSGSDFVEMFVGVGPARVRDLFAKARAEKNGAIIFIDEIDAIGRPRGLNSMYGGGNDERENTLNQLLVEMDGFKENENIVVLASTNVEAEGLDPALLRPGRFDRQIVVDKPDKKERIAIFNVHLKNLRVADEVKNNLEKLAQLTPGMTGADIANVCNEAGIYAVRADKDMVYLIDIEKAIERVVGGLERKHMPITPEERNVIAHHEAGHAIVSWFLRFTDPLLKISIIPRGKALGYAQYLPQEKYIRTYEHLMDFIAQALGGRVAERIIFGHLSTGAQDDLQKITRIAYAAVSSFGMSKSVGPVSFPIPGDPSISLQKPYSESTAETIDAEVQKIINEAYDRTEKLLTEKKDLLQNVAQYLIKNESMSVEDFKNIVGPRPFPEENPEDESATSPSQTKPGEFEPKEEKKDKDQANE